MQQFQMNRTKDLYFCNIDNHMCLIDTGSPQSFGIIPSLTIDGISFIVDNNYMNLSASRLSEMTGESIDTLIGADILSNFDIKFDSLNNVIEFSADNHNDNSEGIDIDFFMGIPYLETFINSKSYKMFFDTGASISYLQDESISLFPFIESSTDFYPNYGNFDTDTYLVDVMIGTTNYKIKCGTLPGLLGMSLTMANIDGIIGNEIMGNHVLKYSPRNGKLVII
jgi:hypothetical protein